MSLDHSSLSVRQLCEVIDLLNSSVDDYLYVYDFVNDFYYISPHAADRFCIPGNAFHDVVRSHAQFVHPDDLPRLQQELLSLISSSRSIHNMVYRWLSRDGHPVWINCRGCVIRDQEKALYMLGCINEIGARPKADNISGLLGETSLMTFLQNLRGELPDGYLLRLGLDDFRGINERLGSDYGDRILRRTADMISDCLLPGQMLYRAVADEFLVLDLQGGTIRESLHLYRQIRRSIDQFVESNHYEAVFTISAGVLDSKYIRGRSYTDTIKLSEFSLNEAKRKGKNRCYVFRQEDYDAFQIRKEQTKLLRQAVNHDFSGFEAYLQPLIYTDTGELYGAEVLMRFHTERFGMLSPATFIPILEETGLIIPAGRWILRQGLLICKEIRKTIPDFRISVNISHIQILKSGILNEILDLADECGVSTSAIILELTESGLLESTHTFSKLWNKLKRYGISLALDDFGTGYSNFHYLNDLRPDLIKIDRSFLAKALENPYEYNLLCLLGSMTHSLNMKFCLEGIETARDLSRILEIHPDYCQGFYFGKPCPYNTFVEKYVCRTSADYGEPE